MQINAFAKRNRTPTKIRIVSKPVSGYGRSVHNGLGENTVKTMVYGTVHTYSNSDKNENRTFFFYPPLRYNSRTQRIVIYYRFIGYIELPNTTKQTHIADTRKGVAVEYITEQFTA